MVYEYRSTRDTGDRGGGSRIRLPPPRQPLPHGGDSPIDTVPREETTTSRSHLIIPEILFPPRARLSGLSPDTARPLWRGREEAASRWWALSGDSQREESCPGRRRIFQDDSLRRHRFVLWHCRDRESPTREGKRNFPSISPISREWCIAKPRGYPPRITITFK